MGRRKTYFEDNSLNDLFLHLKDTQRLLDAVNKQNGFHAHLSNVEINPYEPFGAMLWHRRTSMEFPLCVASNMCQIDIKDMIKLELGWAMPKDNFKQIMGVLYIAYGLSLRELKLLYEKGIAYQNEKPIDLSYYLGIDLPEYFIQYRPAEVYGMPIPQQGFIRHGIEVVTQKYNNGVELPKQIVWTDGRIFPIEKIDVAQEAARFKTGGVGTRFSCWLKGQQRNICFENRGNWFVETPRFA